MEDGLRKLVIGVAALALLVLLTACEVELGSGPKGSGVETTSRRATAAFTRVDLRGDAQVSIVAGRTRSVTVRGDDNLIGRVKTKVEGDTLVISTRHYRSKIGMSVEIGVPALNGVELSGSGSIDVHELSGAFFSAGLSGSGEIEVDGTVDELDLDISGSGDISASGTAGSLEVEIPGSGGAHLDRLSALKARANISGSGDVSLRATTSLNASISGSGDISYAGRPRHLIKDVSGSGTISAR
jgi:hypothetical protein